MRTPTSIEAYFLGAITVLLVGLVQRPHFDEIDVERLNVVEKDGTLRMTISNSARLPDDVIGGKSYPLRSGSKGRAGILFFNEEGNESGGLTYSGKGNQQSLGLTMDQINQDEAVTLGYGGGPQRFAGGLDVLDRPETSIQPMAESLMVFRALPDGPEKTRRMAAFRDNMVKTGQGGYTRVFAGKTPDRTATMILADTRGKPRLKLTVDSTGKAGIDFLDADGHVTDHFPEARRPSSQRP